MHTEHGFSKGNVSKLQPICRGKYPNRLVTHATIFLKNNARLCEKGLVAKDGHDAGKSS